jgi:hypothetical protein
MKKSIIIGILIRNTEISVIIIDPKNIAEQIRRLGSKAPFNCRLNPSKNPEAAIDRTFPSVKDIAYLIGFPVNRPKIEPNEIISMKIPSPNVTKNAIILSLKDIDGKQLSSSSSDKLLVSCSKLKNPDIY